MISTLLPSCTYAALFMFAGLLSIDCQIKQQIREVHVTNSRGLLGKIFPIINKHCLFTTTTSHQSLYSHNYHQKEGIKNSRGKSQSLSIIYKTGTYRCPAPNWGLQMQKQHRVYKKNLTFPKYLRFTSFCYNLQSFPHTGFTKYNYKLNNCKKKKSCCFFHS